MFKVSKSKVYYYNSFQRFIDFEFFQKIFNECKPLANEQGVSIEKGAL